MATTTKSAKKSAKLPVLRVHVLHAATIKPIAEARAPMLRTLEERLAERFDVNLNLVTDFDPSLIKPEELKDTFNLSLPDDTPDPELYKTLVGNLHARQASNLLKHLAALRAIADAPAGETGHQLVLEDDIVFNADVAERLERVLALATAARAGIVMLGLPSAAPAQDDKDKKEGDKPMPRLDDVAETFRVLPACDSYLVTPKAARELIKAFVPCRFIANVQLTYAASRAGLKLRSAVPNVFVDGTKVGVYVSALTPNNRLFLNEDYNKLMAILRREGFKDEDYAEATALYTESRYRGHPDMAVLIAALEAKAGRYPRALELMGQIFEVYRKNDTLLGAESEFLRSYIALHRFVADMPAPPTPSVEPGAKLTTLAEDAEDVESDEPDANKAEKADAETETVEEIEEIPNPAIAKAEESSLDALY